METSQQLIVLAQFRARPDAVEAVKQTLGRAVTPTRTEAGNISYDLYQSGDDPTLFVFFERWTGRDTHQAHVQQPHLQQMLRDVADDLAGPYSAMSLLPVVEESLA